jgi:hypothetical protein
MSESWSWRRFIIVPRSLLFAQRLALKSPQVGCIADLVPQRMLMSYSCLRTQGPSQAKLALNSSVVVLIVVSAAVGGFILVLGGWSVIMLLGIAQTRRCKATPQKGFEPVTLRDSLLDHASHESTWPDTSTSSVPQSLKETAAAHLPQKAFCSVIEAIRRFLFCRSDLESWQRHSRDLRWSAQLAELHRAHEFSHARLAPELRSGARRCESA